MEHDTISGENGIDKREGLAAALNALDRLSRDVIV